MWKLPVSKLSKKSRKYPIKRDPFGRSGRRRASDAFDKGKRPSRVAVEEGIKPKTSYRYYQDWKKLPENYEMHYKAFKTLKSRGIELSEETLKFLAEGLGMSQEEVTERLEKPWGLKGLTSKGSWS